MESSTKTLTVVVINPDNKPTEGANVRLEPGGATGVTAGNGEIQLPLGRAAKYDVTVEVEDAVVTVPYYVTKNGATRLVVNPMYVKGAQEQSNPLSMISSDYLPTLSIGLGIILALLILWKLLRWR